MLTARRLFVIWALTLAACSSPTESNHKAVQLVTLDPGHFHAALVQKTMYPTVDSTVHVYAPPGAEVQAHLSLIAGYNQRETDPTAWNEVVYTGNDYLEQMLNEKAGNVVVMAGNNARKPGYILQSLRAGFNVLADKPMVINADGFDTLVQAFETARNNNLLLYDIMTERFEITTILQRELSQIPAIFGDLEKGSTDNPAITKESVHHFYKHVSGSVLTRPAWFLDVAKQGEGIVDVTSHLVDLVQWECFPEEALDFKQDVHIDSARHWTTPISLNEFTAITHLDQFPGYLEKDVTNDTLINVYCNGAIDYHLKNVYAHISVAWKYRALEATDGTGDTHYSLMRGTKANLIIRQGAEQQYRPVLYIEPIAGGPEYKTALAEGFKAVQDHYPGVELKANAKGWEITVPDKYAEGHEAHFARVMNHFLDYLENGTIPDWEVPNMITKYYTTTQALKTARGK